MASTYLLPLIALTAGLARGFSGFGAALIFMPLSAALIGPKLAAPLFMVMDSVVALPMLRDAWGRGLRRDVVPMLMGAVVGVPLGTYALTMLDPLLLRWIIVALVASMLVLLISGWRYHGEPHRAITAFVGALSGLAGGVAQIAGPPVVAYWMGGAGTKQTVRANMVLFFAGTTVLQLFSYGGSGLISREALWGALVTAPFYGLGLYLGSRMFGRANEKIFRGVSLVLITVALVVSLPVWQ